ncbi:hypothetical protein GPALN_005842, partial [Globodera pallida]
DTSLSIRRNNRVIFQQWLVNGLVAKGERQCRQLNMPLRVMTCRIFGGVPIENSNGSAVLVKQRQTVVAQRTISSLRNCSTHLARKEQNMGMTGVISCLLDHYIRIDFLFELCVSESAVPGAVLALDGVFAFAVIYGDEFMAARDPIGVKPLYWDTDAGGRKLFSSEIKVIEDSCVEMAAFPPGHFYTPRLGPCPLL